MDLSASILVAYGVATLVCVVCAVLAWSNAQPRVIRGLRDSMQALEAGQAEWLTRMDSFADAARHDLELADGHRKKAQAVANRGGGRQVPAEAPNGPTLAFDTGDAGIAQAAAYWAGR